MHSVTPLQAIYQYLAKRLSEERKAPAVALISIGATAGGVAAMTISPQLIATPLGWQGTFYVWAFAGYLWLPLWLYYAVDDIPTGSHRSRHGSCGGGSPPSGGQQDDKELSLVGSDDVSNEAPPSSRLPVCLTLASQLAHGWVAKLLCSYGTGLGLQITTSPLFVCSWHFKLSP
jgi:hypothetical protein